MPKLNNHGSSGPESGIVPDFERKMRDLQAQAQRTTNKDISSAFDRLINAGNGTPGKQATIYNKAHQAHTSDKDIGDEIVDVFKDIGSGIEDAAKAVGNFFKSIFD